jgi:hypothetical protein
MTTLLPAFIAALKSVFRTRAALQVERSTNQQQSISTT